MANDEYLEGVDELSMDARYKAAFPSYKVYIYGRDITGDVEAVRINQSGGSLERAPSTCSITLANYREKYTLTHQNMIVIGTLQADVMNQESIRGVDSLANYKGSYDPESFGFEYANPYLGTGALPETTENISGQVSEYLENLDDTKKSELFLRLSTSTDDEVRYLLEAEGLVIRSVEEARAIASMITTAKMTSKFDRVMEFGGSDFELGELGESDLNYTIKDDVIREKLQYTQLLSISEDQAAVSRIVKQQEGIMFDYPFQEGDCVFNLNDPVRVAFRDPFNPLIWYWMFTGFMDAWTEDIGPNLDSTLTINCTDVTKMARYTVSNVRAGILDANIDKILRGINDSGTGEAKQSGVRMTKDIFAGLSIAEIIELNFFGSESAVNIAEASRSSAVVAEQFYRFFDDFIESDDMAAGTSSESRDIDESKMCAFLARYGLTTEQQTAVLYQESDTLSSVKDIKSRAKGYVKDLSAAGRHSEGIVSKLTNIAWEGITAPRKIPFKRRNMQFGIHYYVYGDKPNEWSKSLGAKSLDSFHAWNEVIHHRVRKDDLRTMATSESISGEIDAAFIDSVFNAKPNASTTSESSQDPVSANYTIEQVMDIIGTNLKKYPVGHGRVFYLAPAHMNEYDAEGVVDRGYGGTGNFHSVFKDRLSLLYDIAQTIEWRFYATPKGDVVFEHPLYDNDPFEFFYPKDLSTGSTRMDSTDTAASGVSQTYEEVFQQEYSGSYNEDSAKDLTDLIFELNTSDRDLIDLTKEPQFNYEKQFTIGIDEQLSFSNTNSDKGLLTVYRAKPHNAANWKDIDTDAARQFVYAIDKTLIPTLGFRMMDGAVETYIATVEGGLLFTSLKLRQINSEARSVSIETIPKFGLMVNRPLLWRYRNYYANVVSCSHSISWNNDVSSSVNLNQIRAWSGRLENGKPVYYHFGGDKAFNWSDFMSKSTSRKKRKTGVE